MFSFFLWYIFLSYALIRSARAPSYISFFQLPAIAKRQRLLLLLRDNQFFSTLINCVHLTAVCAAIQRLTVIVWRVLALVTKSFSYPFSICAYVNSSFLMLALKLIVASKFCIKIFFSLFLSRCHPDNFLHHQRRLLDTAGNQQKLLCLLTLSVTSCWASLIIWQLDTLVSNSVGMLAASFVKSLQFFVTFH